MFSTKSNGGPTIMDSNSKIINTKMEWKYIITEALDFFRDV